MKLNLKRLALALVAVPALTIGMSGCSMVGQQSRTAETPADLAEAASQEGQGVPDSQQYRSAPSRQGVSRGNPGMFGFLRGGC